MPSLDFSVAISDSKIVLLIFFFQSISQLLSSREIDYRSIDYLSSNLGITFIYNLEFEEEPRCLFFGLNNCLIVTQTDYDYHDNEVQSGRLNVISAFCNLSINEF